MDPKKRIVERKTAEVAKAGRLFLEAMFGDHREAFRRVGEEIVREREPGRAITVRGESKDDE